MERYRINLPGFWIYDTEPWPWWRIALTWALYVPLALWPLTLLAVLSVIAVVAA